MKKAAFALLPLLVACFTELDSESTDRAVDPIWTNTGPDVVAHDTSPCDIVLCAPGHTCSVGCEGQAVCNPVVCEGFAGWQCQDGFTCKRDNASWVNDTADQGGVCVRDCEECGECISDADCQNNDSTVPMVCSTRKGECLSSCSCPMCDVCAGHCVPAPHDAAN